MRERFVVVTEEGKYFFVHKVELENTHKKISLAANSELSRRNFFTRVEKYLKDDKHHSLYFFAKICLKTFRILEQTLSADKYPCIFSRQFEDIVDIKVGSAANHFSAFGIERLENCSGVFLRFPFWFLCRWYIYCVILLIYVLHFVFF